MSTTIKSRKDAPPADVQAANQRLLDGSLARETGADQRGWDVVKPQ